MAHGVGPADRVGLSEQVVRETDIAIRVSAGKLRERSARPGSDLGLVDAEQRGEVRVPLAALQEELQQRLLVARERHGNESLRSQGAWRFSRSRGRRAFTIWLRSGHPARDRRRALASRLHACLRRAKTYADATGSGS